MPIKGCCESLTRSPIPSLNGCPAAWHPRLILERHIQGPGAAPLLAVLPPSLPANAAARRFTFSDRGLPALSVRSSLPFVSAAASVAYASQPPPLRLLPSPLLLPALLLPAPLPAAEPYLPSAALRLSAPPIAELPETTRRTGAGEVPADIEDLPDLPLLPPEPPLAPLLADSGPCFLLPPEDRQLNLYIG